MDLTGRHFLKLLDYTPEEINYLIDLAAELKRLKKAGIPVDTLRGKNVALIFEKTSTRNPRAPLRWPAHDLGMGCHLPGSGQLPDRQKGEHRGYRTRCWDGCSTALSTAASGQEICGRAWPNMQAFRYGTA